MPVGRAVEGSISSSGRLLARLSTTAVGCPAKLSKALLTLLPGHRLTWSAADEGQQAVQPVLADRLRPSRPDEAAKALPGCARRLRRPGLPAVRTRSWPRAEGVAVTSSTRSGYSRSTSDPGEELVPRP